MKALLLASVPIVSLLPMRVAAGEWAKLYGDMGAEAFTDVVPMADDGVIAVGRTSAPGSAAALWIVRVDATGAPTWERTIAGLDAGASASACVDADGFLRVVATTRCEPGTTDAWLLQLSQAGDLVSQACYGTAALDEAGLDVDAKPGGGFVLAGSSAAPASSNPSCFMLELRPDGGIQREWTCGPGSDYSFTSMAVAASGDGGFVVAGDLDSTSSEDSTLALAKSGPSGRSDWTGTHGTGLSGELTGVARTEDGGFVAAGSLETRRADGPHGCVTRVDASGRLAWQVLADGSGTETLRSVVVLRDGSIVAVGAAQDGGRPADGWLIVLDAAGRESRQLRLGTSSADTAMSVAETVTGDVVVVGVTSGGGASGSDAWMMRLDAASLPSCGFAWTTSGVAAPPPDAGHSLQYRGAQAVTHDVVRREAASAMETISPAHVDACVQRVPPGEVSPPGAATPLLFTSKADLRWEEAAWSGSDVFLLHRGRVSSLRLGAGSCLQGGLVSPGARDPTLPGIGDAWFYLVAGRNDAGDGPLGRNSTGAERVPLDACR